MQRRIDIGELALHELKLANGPAELLPLMQEWKDEVERGLHDADGPAGEYRALHVEAPHHHVDAAVDLPEDIANRDLAVVEPQGTGVRAAHPQLVGPASRGYPAIAALHDECGDGVWIRGVTLVLGHTNFLPCLDCADSFS